MKKKEGEKGKGKICIRTKKLKEGRETEVTKIRKDTAQTGIIIIITKGLYASKDLEKHV